MDFAVVDLVIVVGVVVGPERFKSLNSIHIIVDGMKPAKIKRVHKILLKLLLIFTFLFNKRNVNGTLSLWPVI